MRPPRENGINEEPSAEVELNAQDLLGLAGFEQNQQPVPSAVASVTPAPDQSSQSKGVHAALVDKSVLATGRRLTFSTTLTLCFALTAIIAGAAMYLFATPAQQARSFTSNWHPKPEPVEPTVDASPSEAPPVRFTNPFDKTEVFEFPAGTGKAEARAAVAEILRQRAMERR